MTTIITRNGSITADRRKAASYYGTETAVTGVIDEAKIHAASFCYYGMSGVDNRIAPTGISEDHIEGVRDNLAIIVALRYLKSIEFFKLLPGNMDYKEYDDFLLWLDGTMVIIAGGYAETMEKTALNIVCLDKQGVFRISDGKFSEYSHNDLIVTGAGKDHASILLHNGFSLDDVYHSLRLSDCPSGTARDTFDIKDLPDLIPPFSQPKFLKHLVKMFKIAAKGKSAKEVIMSEDQMRVGLSYLTILVATLISIANVDENNDVIFSPVNTLNEGADSKDLKQWHFKIAKVFTGYKEEKKQS